MKILICSFILFFIVIFSNYSFPQDTLVNKPFLENAKELSNPSDIYKLNIIYDLDVFEYYDLSQYSTELEKKNFRKTSEYLGKYDELKLKKNELLHTSFFINWDCDISNYIIKEGGFNLSLGTNSGLGLVGAISPKTISDIYFPTLPTKRITYLENSFGTDVREEVLPIRVNEKVGSMIEENKGEISVYLIFKISGKRSISFNYLNEGDDTWYKNTQVHLFANKVVIIIANDKTGEIYFKKFY